MEFLFCNFGLAAEAENQFSGFRRLTGSPNNCSLIFSELFQPTIQVRCVIIEVFAVGNIDLTYVKQYMRFENLVVGTPFDL